MRWPASVLTLLLLSLLAQPSGSRSRCVAGKPPEACMMFLFSPLFGQRPIPDDDKEKTRLRIGITKEQQDQIEAIYAETDRNRREIGKKLRDSFHQLMTSCYDNYDYDRNQAMALRKEIMRAHRRLLDIHADNEEKLRHILNKEQFDKLRALMKERWERQRREFERNRPKPPP